MVIMEMSDHRIIDLAVSRKILHEMTHVYSLPLARSLRSIRMLLILDLSVIARIDHKRRTVRHDDKRGISPSGSDGMDIHITLLPLREVFLRSRQLQCQHCCGQCHYDFLHLKTVIGLIPQIYKKSAQIVLRRPL